MMSPLTNTFIFISILSLIWLLLVITRPHLRREMMILGILSLFLLPLTFTLGETDPTQVQSTFQAIGVQELILSIVLAGIAGVVFHAITGKNYHRLPRMKRKRPHKKKDSHAQHWFLRLFITILFFVWIVLLLNLFFDISLATSALIAAVMLAIYMISHRHDLLLDAVWSSLLTALIVALAASIAGSVTGEALELPLVQAGGMIGNVPTDLFVWSLAIGLALGPVYEFVRRFEMK